MTTYYAAYGSNLNKAQMATRCPAATPHRIFQLPDYKLCFKGVADIIKSKGDTAPVVLWNITPECELALDRYEGYPKLYRKQYWQWGKDMIMAYVMNGYDIAPPSKYYFEGIQDGYGDFGMPLWPLNNALREACASDGVGYTPKRFRVNSKPKIS